MRFSVIFLGSFCWFAFPVQKYPYGAQMHVGRGAKIFFAPNPLRRVCFIAFFVYTKA